MGIVAKEIDHVLVRTCQNCGRAEFCGSDHRLAVVTLQRETFDVAQESIGERPRTRQNYISLEILEATDVCRMARLNGNQDLRRSLVRRARTLLRRDKEHFIRNLAEEVDPPAVSLDARDVAIHVSGPPTSEDPPILTEVREAISKLKGWKGAGICDIPAELLKTGGEPVAPGLHVVLATIWQSGSVPPDLLRGMVNIGTSNYRGITAQYTRQMLPRREFGHGLLAAYIDLKKAFDSIHRESLWEILRLKGILTQIIELIASLYTGTESAAKCGLLD
nr:uncharacterized protein LOC113801282 [Penaeus vannamei]